MAKLSNSAALHLSLEALSAVAVKQMEELSNSTAFGPRNAGKFFIFKVHRYLQSNCIKWMLDIIDAIGHALSHCLDLRNQRTKGICCAMIKAAEDAGLYYSKYTSDEGCYMSGESSTIYDNSAYKNISAVRKFFELGE